jgi:acetylornithine deacetylase
MFSGYNEAIAQLKQLISIPSVSREENGTAHAIEQFFLAKGIKPFRKGNNVWVTDIISDKYPVLLLNSHHDTVKPSTSWTIDPYTPIEKDGKLYGLGSNDAGASLVSLMQVFLHYFGNHNRKFNLIFAASAEEELGGKNGIESIKPELGKIDLAIVGEPTLMQMAVAEKGLMVVDGKTSGVAGHSARNEGVNAIYKALPDIEWFRTFKFPKESDVLGAVKMTITQINAGYQHNMVPDLCSFVVDVRTNEHYSNEQAFEIIKEHMQNTEVAARSTRLNSSKIPLDHPLVKRGLELGLSYYGSPTTSDQAIIRTTSMKIGPGDSARSHSADEFVYLEEIKKGIEVYIQLLDGLEFL